MVQRCVGLVYSFWVIRRNLRVILKDRKALSSRLCIVSSRHFTSGLHSVFITRVKRNDCSSQWLWCSTILLPDTTGHVMYMRQDRRAAQTAISSSEEMLNNANGTPRNSNLRSRSPPVTSQYNNVDTSSHASGLQCLSFHTDTASTRGYVVCISVYLTSLSTCTFNSWEKWFPHLPKILSQSATRSPFSSFTMVVLGW